jgi:hypothetical protein
MTHCLDIPLGAIDRNVVFGALIGVETLFLVSQSRVRGAVALWGMLLPALLCAGSIEVFVVSLLRSMHAAYLSPFFCLLIAAGFAQTITAIHRRGYHVGGEDDGNLLLFASMTALLITLPNWGGARLTWSLMLVSAGSLWLGFGIGLACFASLGPRLHGLAKGSRVTGVILFILTLAVIATALGGVTGLRIGLSH